MQMSASALTAHQLNPSGSIAADRSTRTAKELNSAGDGASPELKEKFQEFVAGTFYKTLLAEMRKTVSGKSLIHGGRAEEIFQAQMDQTLTDRLAAADGASFSDELFEQFTRQLGLSPTPSKSQGEWNAGGVTSLDVSGAGNGT